MESTGAAVDRVDERVLLVSLFGAVAVISGAFLLALIFQSVVALALGVQSPEAIQGQPGLYTVLSASTFVGFIAAAVGFLSLRDEWDVLHVRRPTLRDVAFVVAGLLALAVAATVTSALVSAIIAVLDSVFGVDAQFATNEVIETGQQNPTTFLYMIPVAILLVGPGEELVFRGVVQGLLRRAVGVVPAILLASLLFGLGHYLAIASGNAWTYVFVAGAMGIVLGAIYEYTENIAVPVAIHGLWNAAIFANQWANATGASLPF